MKRLLSIVGLIVVIVLGIAYWLRAAERMPVVHFPAKKLPTPNAYDTFTKAANSLKGENKIWGAYLNTTAPKHPLGPDDRLYSLEERQQLIKDNVQALKLLRIGLKQEFCYPKADNYDSLARLREISKLLVIEARIKAEHGDWSGAVNSYIDSIEFGAKLPNGGGTIQLLLGKACQSIGSKEAWDAIDHLDATTAKSAAKRIENINKIQVPLSKCLEEEKWILVSDVIKGLKNPAWRGYLAHNAAMMDAKTFDAISDEKKITDFLHAPGVLFTTKHRVVNDLLADSDAIIARAQKPYAARSKPPTLDSIKYGLTGTYDRAWASITRTNAINELLAVSFALRAYKLEHGVYPDKLGELVPSYLSKVPDDPFAIKKPLMYRKTNNNYCVLYSIGYDGKDDRGTPLYYPNGKKKGGLADRKGDIVAGIDKY